MEKSKQNGAVGNCRSVFPYSLKTMINTIIDFQNRRLLHLFKACTSFGRLCGVSLDGLELIACRKSFSTGHIRSAEPVGQQKENDSHISSAREWAPEAHVGVGRAACQILA